MKARFPSRLVGAFLLLLLAHAPAALAGFDIPSRCVGFSPYVGAFDPETGPHPAPAQIDAMLDRLVATSDFRCIMTYGVLNGQDYVFQSATARGLKVIAILWLDNDPAVNQASITNGIRSARAFANTIIGLSCGSEFRTRNGPLRDAVIRDCISQLRAAGVVQPITSIDTWWQWCAQSSPCQSWNLVNQVDWIGINIFPWWENKYSGLHRCTPATRAADFHVARLQEVRARYPTKAVFITEYGWPAGPEGYQETNQYSGQPCAGAEAGESNQQQVIFETRNKLDALGLRGIAFESFRQGNWKTRFEGAVGPMWGICQGAPADECKRLGPTRARGQTSIHFDQDRKSDMALYRNGSWHFMRSSDNTTTTRGFGGMPQDIPVPADYDGDGKTDMAVYRNGTWHILRSTDNLVVSIVFGGLPQDVPVPADYDGDGKADLAVFRDGTWSIFRSSDSVVTATDFGGMPEDILVPADYDGDGKADIAVYRTGTWHVLRSSDEAVVSTGFGGMPEDIPVPADYDGDGRTDMAVYRTGTWYVLRSSDDSIATKGFGGSPLDVPAPADYDGDGKTDMAVYRNGTWHVLRSSDNGVSSRGFGGSPQDVPL